MRYGTQYRSFNTTHPSDDVFAQERHTKERFLQHNVEVSRMVLPWLYASVSTQFANNAYTEDEATKTFTGFSNLSLALTTQKLLHTADNGNNAYWISRAQIAAPIGTSKSNAEDKGYSESMYPSTGAYAYAGAMQLVYNTKRSVFYAQSNVSFSGETSRSYRFGTAINASLGGVNDVWKLKENKTVATGAELSYFHTYQNEFRNIKLSENNGSYALLYPQIGYKSEKFSVFVKKSIVLHQNIGAGNTNINQQLEINLTFKI